MLKEEDSNGCKDLEDDRYQDNDCHVEVSLKWDVLICQWVSSGANVEVEHFSSGCHDDHDLGADCETDDPDVEEQVPEVILESYWVLEPEDEEVPTEVDANEKQNLLEIRS